MNKNKYFALAAARRNHTVALKRYFLNAAVRMRAELRQTDLEHYEEEIAEVGDLIYMLELAFDSPKRFNFRYYERLRVIQPPCREVERVEHLKIASLLIEAYCSLEAECYAAMTECEYNRPTDFIRGWEELCRAYKNAVYGVLLRADFHLAILWRKGDISWQELADEIDKKRLTL